MKRLKINDKYSKAKYLDIECITTGYINGTKFCAKKTLCEISKQTSRFGCQYSRENSKLYWIKKYM